MDNATQNAQNVVTMSQFVPETGYAALSQVEAYWEALRAGRLIPKRSEIDPRGIEGALEHAFILERIAPGIARMRVAGTHMNDLMGMEVRGMPLTTFFAPANRRLVADTLEDVFQTPAICTLTLTAPAAPVRPALTGKLLIMPLKSDLGDVSRALGCFVTKGKIGVAPRRFDIASQTFTPLLPGNALMPDDRGDITPHSVLGAPLPAQNSGPKEVADNPGFAEPRITFGAKRDKRPPYLRLIKSDD